jgi:hypothetical protein
LNFLNGRHFKNDLSNPDEHADSSPYDNSNYDPRYGQIEYVEEDEESSMNRFGDQFNSSPKRKRGMVIQGSDEEIGNSFLILVQNCNMVKNNM